MRLPSLTEYQDALQSPRSCFALPELQRANPETDKLGLPKPMSGNFAVVFPMVSGGSKFAVRCFSTYPQDQELRYEKISHCLAQKKLSCMVGFDFVKKGIKIKNQWYPILKMDWVHGEPLNRYVEKNLNRPKEILALAERFFSVVCELQKNRIAHGDLQHGNILVTNGAICLVDYDGMYVPGLDGMRSNEIGHRNYQHPKRTAQDFGPHIDNFSAWCIYVSLIALGADPALWRRLDGGDEHLLLRRQDIESPSSSDSLRALERISDKKVRALISCFRNEVVRCSQLAQIPPLDGKTVSVREIKPVHVYVEDEEALEKTAAVPTGAEWVTDHMKHGHVKEIRPSAWEHMGAKTLLLAGLFLGSTAFFNMPVSTFSIITLGFSLPLMILIIAARFLSLPEARRKSELSSTFREKRNEMRDAESALKKLETRKDKLIQQKTRRVNEISTRQGTCKQEEQKELGKVSIELRDKLANINSQRQVISKAENAEVEKALKAVQNQFFAAKLCNHSLDRAAISGIGSEMKKRLHAHGIRTAADIIGVQLGTSSYGQYSHDIALIQVLGRKPVRVEGIGPKKAQALLAWRKSLEQNYKNQVPHSLPSAEANAVKAKFAGQKAQLDSQEADANRTAAQKKDAVRDKYRKQQDALEQELAQARAMHAKEIKELDIKIAEEGKRLVDSRYRAGRLENELKPFQNLRLATYLRRAVLF